MSSVVLGRIVLFFTSLICGLQILRVIGYKYAMSVNGYRRGNRFRFSSILMLEWIMLHVDICIYHHLFYSIRSHETSKPNARCNSKFYYCLFLVTILSAHLTYLLYLAESFEVPNLIFGATAICNGIWIHLATFSVSFLAINFIVDNLNCLKTRIKSCNGLINRLFTDNKLQVIITLVATLILSLTHWYASDKLVVRELELKINPYITPTHIKVAVVTDLHIGQTVHKEQIKKIVDLVNLLDADAVFLIGDIVDAPISLIEARTEPLKYIRSNYGTYYVTGNHEYYYGDVEKWIELFKSYGIRCLLNERTEIKGHCIVGLNDISSDKSGIANHSMNVSVIEDCPNDRPTIVLAHNPNATKAILEYTNAIEHRVDFIISGHTHCGQFLVLVPFIYWVLPYFCGLYEINAGQTKLLVSAGTLFQNAPMKIPWKSEIWSITIKS